jgi:hypothetical protein
MPNKVWNKCPGCGKFIGYKDMQPGGDAVAHGYYNHHQEDFIQEINWYHQKCL